MSKQSKPSSITSAFIGFHFSTMSSALAWCMMKSSCIWRWWAIHKQFCPKFMPTKVNITKQFLSLHFWSYVNQTVWFPERTLGRIRHPLLNNKSLFISQTKVLLPLFLFSYPQSLVSRSLLRERDLWSIGLSGEVRAHSWTACPCPQPCSPPLTVGCSDSPWAPSALQKTACLNLSW